MDVEESNRLRQLAKASYDQGKYQEALDHLKKAQETLVYPHTVVQKEIALTLGQLHQYEEAIHYYGVSLHLQEDHFTRLNRAFAFLGAGRWSEAKADADQALRAMVLANTPRTSRVMANEVLAYAAAKLEHHDQALVHADLAVKDAMNGNISANWVQNITNFVDMVNEIRRKKGTSEDIVIFPSLGQMTEGLAWLETGDINRAHQLLEQSQTLHQGDSWFIESALAKVAWQLGKETQAKGHLVKTIMRRDQGNGQDAKEAVLQALENCDLQASARTTYGTYQWSTCPEDQVNLAIHTSDAVRALQEAEARAMGQGRFNEITDLYEEAKRRESATPVPDPTPGPWPAQTPQQTPVPTTTPNLPTPSPLVLEMRKSDVPTIAPIPMTTRVPSSVTRIEPAITRITPKTVMTPDGQSYTLRPLPHSPPTGESTPIREEDRLSTIADLANAKWLEQKYPDVAARIKALPWIRDGATAHETDTIQQLIYLMHSLDRGMPAGTRTLGLPLLEHPFIQDRSPGDHTAIQSLYRTARKDIHLLNHILTNPLFAETGFTDEWTPVLSILHQAADEDPASIDRLLDPSQTSIQSEVIQLPLRGEVQLNIIRTRSHGPNTAMDHIARAVRYLEGFMGLPFPVDQVNMIYADELVTKGFAGTNFGSGFSMKRDLEEKPDHEANTIVHETAHYYWNGMENWVDEGMPELLTAHYKMLYLGYELTPSEYPCGEVKNISQLAGQSLSKGDRASKCNYTLGERLFIELLTQLGEQTFAQKAQALYLRALENDKLNRVKERRLFASIPNAGIEEVRQAFDSHPLVEKWYLSPSPSIDMREEGETPTWMFQEVAATIHDVGITNEIGQPELPSIRKHQRKTIYGFIKYSQQQAHGTPWEVNLTLEEYYLDERYRGDRIIQVTGESNTVGGSTYFSVGPSTGRNWEVGWHRAILYDETGVKVAELAWEVKP